MQAAELRRQSLSLVGDTFQGHGLALAKLRQGYDDRSPTGEGEPMPDERVNPFKKLNVQIVLAAENPEERLGYVMAEAYEARIAVLDNQDKRLEKLMLAIAKLAHYARGDERLKIISPTLEGEPAVGQRDILAAIAVLHSLADDIYRQQGQQP